MVISQSILALNALYQLDEPSSQEKNGNKNIMSNSYEHEDITHRIRRIRYPNDWKKTVNERNPDCVAIFLPLPNDRSDKVRPEFKLTISPFFTISQGQLGIDEYNCKLINEIEKVKITNKQVTETTIGDYYRAHQIEIDGELLIKLMLR